jgi:hypothetical protein
MNIFLICPVRNITPEYQEGIETQVKQLESEGHKVYWPARDTNQQDTIGLRICKDNRLAIAHADIVYVIWDGKSQGCLFDLGIAFALRKKIRPVVGYFPTLTFGKSFQNMVYDWEERGSD